MINRLTHVGFVVVSAYRQRIICCFYFNLRKIMILINSVKQKGHKTNSVCHFNSLDTIVEDGKDQFMNLITRSIDNACPIAN